MTMQRYHDLAFGPNARRHQAERGASEMYAASAEWPELDGLGPEEVEFLAHRDSMYLASVGEQGWPYVQHRGGPAGFIHVVDPTHLAWAERAGNRQFVSAGNIDGDDRVSIIAVDYPGRQRLKLFGHARFQPAPDPALVASFGITGRMEALMLVEIVAFDWNCPKYITPRFTADEVRSVVDPLNQRIFELEQLLAVRRQD
jgi:predicted pyridoxine 5'-phosphate oxidase superfamily flavin-nucleotide-binding protein